MLYKKCNNNVKNRHRKMINHSFGRRNSNPWIYKKIEAKFTKELCVGDLKIEKKLKIEKSPLQRLRILRFSIFRQSAYFWKIVEIKCTLCQNIVLNKEETEGLELFSSEIASRLSTAVTKESEVESRRVSIWKIIRHAREIWRNVSRA